MTLYLVFGEATLHVVIGMSLVSLCIIIAKRRIVDMDI